MIAHKLTPQDVDWYTYVGVRRQGDAESVGRPDNFVVADGKTGRAWHVQGAAGECAFSRITGLYWEARLYPERGAPDFPPDFQIKTVREWWHRLPIPEHACPSDRYVLMVLAAPWLVYLAGYIRAADAKHEKWRERHNGQVAYWVPRRQLEPVHDIAALGLVSHDRCDV